MKMRLFAFATALAATLATVHAQVSYTGAAYFQNFDALQGTTNNALNVTWADNTTLPGWYAAKSDGSTVPTYNVTNGTIGGSAATFDGTSTANNIGLFSFGSASSTERALGSRTVTAAPNDALHYGVRLVNNTGAAITNFSVLFSGEQWFKSSQATAHTINVSYQLGATALLGGTWTTLPATFSGPDATGTTPTARDGNTATYRRGLAARVSGISWAPGAELWLRFTDGNETGAEQGLAIDDFTFTTENESALFFNGATNYVTAGAATNTLGAQVFTIECWFYRTGVGAITSTGSGGVTTAIPLVTKGRGEAENSNVDCNYFIGIDANTNRLVADFEAYPASGITAGQNYPAISTSALPFNRWTHIAVSYDGAATDGEKWKLYIDGARDVNTNANPPAGAIPRFDSIQHFGIGSAMTSTGVAAGFFQGLIDEVRVWNVARSGADILAGRDLEIASGAGLLGRFGLAEGAGNTAANSANASANGTLTNAPVWLHGHSFAPAAPNAPPTVTLTAPANGASAEAPATINLAATAGDSDGTIARVEFFNGATLLGEDTIAPFTLTVLNAPQGSYSFTAKATDNLGASATSAAAGFTVTPSTNSPPTIAATSPANNATDQPLTVPLQVSVGDSGNDALNVKFFGRRAAPAPGPDFTLVTLPDTQFYSENNNNRFTQFLSQTNWIVSSRTALNTAFVAHMGDMVQNGDSLPAEWARADQAMDIIEQHATTLRAHGLPWGGAPGNHDFGTGGGSGTTNFWNSTFGTARWAGRPYFRGNYATNNNNNYQFFSASGLDFIIINLAYNANTAGDPGTLAWADGLLKTHPHRRAIITSHWIVNTGNPATFGGHGQAIYNELKDNPNLFLMLCGHVHGEGQRTDVFDGRAVYSILQDYQDRAGAPGGLGGGDGWLRYFIFSPANGTISARTYRTTSDTFETDADSQFTLPYNMQAPVSGWVQLDSQDLAGGSSSATFNWNGLEAGRDYEWYAVVSDGVSAVSTSARRFATAVNLAPTVSLTAPANNASFAAPATINFTATAADDGTIARVDFFEGNNRLFSDTTAPYEFAWSGVATGAYVLSAVAVDDGGATVLSNIVNVTVMNPNNVAPTANITAPADGANFLAPANVTVTATATDSDGSVTKVEFYQGATLLGEDLSAPYNFALNGLPVGSYALSVKAFDNDGGSTISATVNVTVTLAPGASFVNGYTQDFNGMGTNGTAPPPNWSVKNNSGGGNGTWTNATGIPGSGLAGMIDAAGVLTATTTPSGSNNNGFNAAATTGDPADRVLASSPTTNAGTAFELKLTNNSGGAVAALRISYETRRYTAASTAGELPGYWLFYSLDDGASWVNVAALNPTLAGPGGVIVPNTIGTATVPTTVFNLASAWANGANLHLRWVDDNATQSSPDQITGLDNLTLQIGQPPAVALTSPAPGATFVAPAMVNLTATASDPDGTIAKVEFFAGATLLGEDTAAPYAISGAGVPAGVYALTARATDNDGNASTSAAVSVTVLADTDGDGLPDSWENAHGLNPNDPADALLDSDGDGFSNRDEFYADTDPQDSADRPTLLLTRELDGSITLRLPTKLGRTYRIEARDQLGTGTWQPLFSDIPGTGGEVTRSDATAGSVPTRFYRALAQP